MDSESSLWFLSKLRGKWAETRANKIFGSHARVLLNQAIARIWMQVVLCRNHAQRAERRQEERQNRVPEGAVYCCGVWSPVQGLRVGVVKKWGRDPRSLQSTPQSSTSWGPEWYLCTNNNILQLRPRALTFQEHSAQPAQSKTKPQIELQVTAERKLTQFRYTTAPFTEM